jgi:hypothetical protein
MLLVLFGARSFELTTGSAVEVIAGATVGAIMLALAAMCFVKQRVLHGAVGLSFFPIAAFGAARIGKPGSPWARRFYGEREPAKQAKAEERFRPDRRTQQRKERFRDAVCGETNEAFQAKLGEQAATREVASEIHSGPSGWRWERRTGSGAIRLAGAIRDVPGWPWWKDADQRRAPVICGRRHRPAKSAPILWRSRRLGQPRQREDSRPDLVPSDRLAGTAGNARISERAGAESREGIPYIHGL